MARRPPAAPTRKRADRYHHGDLRRALLQAAVRTIGSHGVDALTLRGVGSTLGVSRTALHRVIDSGPFALVRHPIYTGMIAAVAAMAVLQARPMAILGAVLFAVGFGLKARVEERFVEAELPEYAAYRQRVGMLVPGIGRSAP